VITLNPEEATGEIVLCERASVVDSRSGAVIVAADDLRKSGAVRGNVWQLRQDELTVFYWQWVTRL
jgi:hypothetical protein